MTYQSQPYYSGCIDILVVKRKDGTQRSSPFHVVQGSEIHKKPFNLKVKIKVNDNTIKTNMRLGLYGDGIFRYTNKSQVISGFLLNKAKNEDTNFGIERSKILVKNGLGSLPEQNLFQSKDPDNDNQEDCQNNEQEDEVNKAYQIVRNISETSLNTLEKSQIKGESSGIFNYLFGFFFKRKKNNVHKDLGQKDYENVSINGNMVEVKEVSDMEFEQMRENFMNQNKDNMNEVIGGLDKEYKNHDPKIIDENMIDARSIHSQEDSSDSDFSDREVNAPRIDVYIIQDETLMECMDLEMIRKQQKINFKEFEQLINSNNFFDNKMVRVVVNINGEEKVQYPLNASAIILSQMAQSKQLNNYTNKKLTESKQQKNKEVFRNWKSDKSQGFNQEIDSIMNEDNEIICSLYPTQEDLAAMNLHQGKNKLQYTCEGRSLFCNIFMYRYDDRLIISDVDGTITKSDILGHICQFLGTDWTHKGIAGLQDLIVKNGYKIIYLTSRPISQIHKTKNLIFEKIKQNEITMPMGPLITSPNGIRDALYNEVINKTPYRFKIDVLTVIKNLFEENPFQAGFGNKVTDMISQTAVGCKLESIFIINPKSEIHYKEEVITQEKLAQRVDEFFTKYKSEVDEEDQNFNIENEQAEISAKK